MDYIAQPKDYWIAPNAVNITLNALGNPNRMQGSVASGAAILCYIEGIDGLGYDNGHRFKTWPLSISPTFFNSNTEKYIYVAIPRSTSVGTQAVVVFPSEQLDIYGVNASDEQTGSTDYYYIWLQGVITSSGPYGDTNRTLSNPIDFGKKGTDEDLYDDTTSEWYVYSKVSEVVTFLKNITMKAGTTFHNLILGYKELTGVATSDIAYTDSDTLVATPGYVESQYLSKTHESEAQEQIGFLKGLWVGVRNLYEITANGIAKLKSVIAEDVNSQRVQTGEIKSPNYTGDGVADTGFRLTNSHNGHSKLTIDELYVRMKAVFESLEVRERTYTGGDQIWSCAGNRINRVDYLGNVETADHVPQMINVHADGRPAGQGQGDVYSVPVPGDTYGYSDVKVPWLLRQMPLLARAKVFARYRKVRIVINEPPASGARRAASENPLANIRRARCYFIAKDDDMEVHNWWRINDLARCQTMNLANTTRQTYISGEDQKAGNIFWWRKVIGVSYEPVTLDDGKQYHYFDVAFDYEYEQTYPEVMATSVMAGSDIPAAQDSVVQFGNTIIEGRMNLMMMEVNGSDAVGYNPTTDAPCLKAYRGIYCFDLSKCWVGGNACKMKLSPKSGYEFYGPNFKQVTEYDVVPVPVDRGLWTDIVPTRDDYREHAMVRKCYYYDKVSHNGSYWLCSIVDSAHWVDSSGNYISDADYSALAEDQKALCSRKQNYTIEEPSANSPDWTEVVQKGDAAPYYVDDYGIGASRTSHSDISSWSSSQPSPTAQKPYVWKRTRLYDPNTQQYGAATYVCLTGDKGANGKDGWMITANPANVIITQNMVTASTFTSAMVGFTAKKGNVDVAISSIGTPTSTEFNVAKGTGNDVKKVVVSSPKTYIPTGETSAVYYSEGSFVVTVNVTDPDSGSTVAFQVTVLCYANLIGSFKTVIEGDVETSVAQKLTYGYDPNSQSVLPISTFGQYIRSSEENISVLTKKIGDGKNLLTGVLDGTGWRGATSSITPHSITGDVIDNWIPCDSGDAYAVSPDVSVQAGTAYTYSFDVPDGVSGAIAVLVYDTSLQLLFTLTTNANGRRKVTFTPTANATVMLYAAAARIRFPQLETGTEATAFESPTTEVVSQIKQTASSIDLSIRSDIETAGVHIDGQNSVINLIAGKVNFKMPDGTANAKVSINPATGTLYATDGEFEGTVRARNLFHGVCIVGKEEYFYCSQTFLERYAIETAWIDNFSLGAYYTSEQIYELSDHDIGDGTVAYGMVACTYKADIVLCPNLHNNQNARYVNLPCAKDFEGKIIEVIDNAYTNGQPMGDIVVTAVDGGKFGSGMWSSGVAYLNTQATIPPEGRCRFYSIYDQSQWWWLKLD